MELALGTVQFGLRYGIAGRGEPVPAAEVRDILHCAWEGGIRLLDTAPGYGDIEQRLGEAMAGQGFRVVSKVPALPEGAGPDWARQQVQLSRERLGDALAGLLFHRAEDLSDGGGEALWEAVRGSLPAGMPLGVSCYGPDTLQALADRYPIGLAQVPANAFDRRFAGLARPMPLHLRSVFLQGLLLLDRATAAQRLPIAAPAVERWRRWCTEQGLSPLVAALGFAKTVPGATHCIVGVDSRAQLESIVAAWHEARPLAAPEVAVQDARIVDPRLWEPRP